MCSPTKHLYFLTDTHHFTVKQHNVPIKKHNVSVTYWMNKLQHIEQKFPLFVTLNPIEKIAEDKLFDVYEFYHPIYNNNSIIELYQ